MLKTLKRTTIVAVTSLLVALTSGVGATVRCEASKLASNKTVTKWGDANCDNSVGIADQVLIMNSIANPDKYALGCEIGITEQGIVNGDVEMDLCDTMRNDWIDNNHWICFAASLLKQGLPQAVFAKRRKTKNNQSQI